MSSAAIAPSNFRASLTRVFTTSRVAFSSTRMLVVARVPALDASTPQPTAPLSRALDAVFIRQSYSRLVVDCNRHRVILLMGRPIKLGDGIVVGDSFG